METATSNQPCHLLQLPLELRNEIYSYIILSFTRTPAPPNPSFPGRREESNEIRYQAFNCGSWRHASLFCVSRQIRNEYLSLVHEYALRTVTKAELDIMSKGYVFYPTWTYLSPSLRGNVPFDLVVNLRIFSTAAYQSNDGWPRQPGAGFRSLLKLLKQLMCYGPSFAESLNDQLRGSYLYAINTLTVNITFHDDYSPDTWPGTSHNIFRMLKALATHGIAGGMIRTIHAHSQYDQRGRKVVYDSIWDVSAEFNASRSEEWRQMGFFTPHQRTLRDVDGGSCDQC